MVLAPLSFARSLSPREAYPPGWANGSGLEECSEFPTCPGGGLAPKVDLVLWVRKIERGPIVVDIDG